MELLKPGLSLCASKPSCQGYYFHPQKDNALKGLNSVKAVFDIRIGNPEMTPIFLNLIHNTFKSKDVGSITTKPEFVFVFLGPMVKFISTNIEFKRSQVYPSPV